MGCTPSGMDCSAEGPLWSYKSSQQKPAPVWASLSVGPQVLSGACSSTCLLRASTCSGVGSSMGCRWRCASLWAAGGQPASTRLSPGAAGEPCSGIWSTSSFFAGLCVRRVLSHILIRFFRLLLHGGFFMLNMLSQRCYQHH